MSIRAVLPSNRIYWMQFIFAGQAFNMQHKFSVAAGATVDIEIITDVTDLMHVTNKTATTSSDEIDIQIIEGPFDNLVDGTTPIPGYNMDRRSAKPHLMQSYSNPTPIAGAITGGTIIETLYLPGNAGLLPTLSSGQNGEGLSERVLKPSTQYIIRAINSGAAIANIQYNWFWYESSN